MAKYDRFGATPREPGASAGITSGVTATATERLGHFRVVRPPVAADEGRRTRSAARWSSRSGLRETGLKTVNNKAQNDNGCFHFTESGSTPHSGPAGLACGTWLPLDGPHREPLRLLPTVHPGAQVRVVDPQRTRTPTRWTASVSERGWRQPSSNEGATEVGSGATPHPPQRMPSGS